MPTAPANKTVDDEEDSPALIEGDPNRPISRSRLDTAVRATSAPKPYEQTDQELGQQQPEQKVIGTTGGEIPTFESDRPQQPVQWSADPIKRQQQVQQEITRRRQAQGSAEHPFLPTAWAPDMSSISNPHDDRKFEAQAEDQFQYQRQQEVAQRRQAAQQAKADVAEYNSQQLQKFTANGQKHYVDPATGKITPVVDEQGRAQFTPTKWELTKHPKTGDTMLMMRDRYGQRQFKEPQVVAGLDPTDENMYHQLPDGTLSEEPAGSIEELTKSPNYRVAKVALAAQKRNVHAKHQEALAGVKSLLDDATESLNTVKTQRDDLDAQIADTEKLSATTTDPTKLDALTATLQQQMAQRDALSERLKPNGDLGNMVSRHRAAYVAAKASQAVDTYKAQEAEIAAAVRARGGKLEDDPAYKDNLRNLQLNEQLRKNAESEFNKASALSKPTADMTGQEKIDDALASAEPYIRAGKGEKMIGSTPIKAFAEEFGDGRGPVDPNSVLKLHDRSKELEDLLKNDSTTRVTPIVLEHLQQEKNYVDTLLKQRFARLPQDQQQKITDITRDPTLGEKGLEMFAGATRGALKGMSEAVKGTTSFFSRRLIDKSVINPDDNAVTRALDQFEKNVDTQIGVKGITPDVRKKLRDSFVTGTAPEMAGQMASLFVPGGVAGKIGKAAGLGETSIATIGKILTAATGAAQGSNSLRQQAVAVLKPKLDAGQITQDEYTRSVGMAELAGGAIGGSAFVPISRMLNRVSSLPTGSTLITSLLERAAKGGKNSAAQWLIGGAGRKAVANVVSEGVEMGGLGFAQQMANDIAAKTIFDPNRKLSMTDASKAGSDMAVIAALMSAFTHALPKGKGPSTPEIPEAPGSTAPKEPTQPPSAPEPVKQSEPAAKAPEATIPAEHQTVIDRLADAAEKAHTGTPEEQAAAQVELEKIFTESEPIVKGKLAEEQAADKEARSKPIAKEGASPKETAKAVLDMSPDDYFEWTRKQPQGQTGESYRIGTAAIGDAEAISSLKESVDIAKQQCQEARDNMRKGTPAEKSQAANDAHLLGFKLQFFNEAIQAAENTGSAVGHPEVAAAHERFTSSKAPFVETTKTENPSNAANEGQQPEENIVQHTRAPSGAAVPENRAEVREGQSEQAGSSDRPIESPRKQPRSSRKPKLGTPREETRTTGVEGKQNAQETSPAPVRKESVKPIEEVKVIEPAKEDIPPSMMKREDRIAELKAGGIATIKGKALEDAMAGETMTALSRLRASKLGNQPIAETSKPDIIDRLKSMKRETAGKLYSAPEALYDVAHNAAIDVAILAIRAGRAVNDVVKLAIDRFKAKFPDYHDEHLAKVEEAVRGAIKLGEERRAAKGKETAQSRVPESLREVGVPAKDITHDVRAQNDRMAEARDLIAKGGDAKAEKLISDRKLPADTRVALGGVLIQQKMDALRTAKPEDVERLTQDIQRITAATRAGVSTESGQGVAMHSKIYENLAVGSAMEYTKEATRQREQNMGGKDIDKAATEAAEELNKAKTKEERDAAIEKLKKKYDTKPAHKMLDALKNIDIAKELNRLGVLTRDDIINLAGNALGIPGISQVKLKHIAELADAVDKAKSHSERARAEIELADTLHIYKGVNPLDLEASNLTLNILSGPTTQAANLEGNALNLVAQLGTTAAVNPSKIGAIMQGLKDGIPLGWDQAKSIMATGRGTRDFQDKTLGAGNALAKVDYARDFPRLNKTVGYILTVRARLLDKISRFMKAADAVFYYPAREAYARLVATKLLEGEFTGAELNKRVSEALHTTPEAFHSARVQAMQEGYTGIDLGRRVADIIEERRAANEAGGKTVKESEQFAAEATYNNEPVGLAGVIYRNLAHTVRDADIAGVPVLKPWAMFLRVPANVFNATTNFTPLGASRALFGMKGERYRRGGTGENQWRNFTKDEQHRLYLQSVIGTTLMAGLVGHIVNGGQINISASGPDDPQKRNQLRASGWNPYSIKVGNKWISYRDSPLIVPLAIIGHTADSMKYQKAKSDMILGSQVADSLAHSPQIIFQTSMLSGLSDLMGSLSGKGDVTGNVVRTLGSIPANLLIPYNRLLQQVDQSFDNTAYDNNPLISGVPFIRRTGNPQVDAQGRTRGYPPASRFVSTENNDPVDNVLREKNVFVPEPSKSTKIGNNIMTEEQYYLYHKLSGQRIRNRLITIAPQLRILNQEKAQDRIDEIARQEHQNVKQMISAGVKR